PHAKGPVAVYPFRCFVKIPTDPESAAHVITRRRQFPGGKFQRIRQRVAAQSPRHGTEDTRQHLNEIHIFPENLVGLWLAFARRSFLVVPSDFHIEAADGNLIVRQFLLGRVVVEFRKFSAPGVSQYSQEHSHLDRAQPSGELRRKQAGWNLPLQLLEWGFIFVTSAASPKREDGFEHPNSQVHGSRGFLELRLPIVFPNLKAFPP